MLVSWSEILSQPLHGDVTLQIPGKFITISSNEYLIKRCKYVETFKLYKVGKLQLEFELIRLAEIINVELTLNDLTINQEITNSISDSLIPALESLSYFFQLHTWQLALHHYTTTLSSLHCMHIVYCLVYTVQCTRNRVLYMTM